MPAIVRVNNLYKNYYLGSVTVNVLKGIDLEIEQGDFVALMGPSGSGKSTLMNILGCLDRPTSGDYFLSGRNVAHLNDDRLSDVRSRYLGFIFQSYNLLPQYTVVENIELPLMYQGIPLNAATRHRCVALAGMIGVASVISLLAFGKGRMKEALDAIKRQGATNIIARSQKPSDDSATASKSFVATYGLTYRDYEKFETLTAINRHVPMRVFPREIRRLERLHNGRVVATAPEYADVNKLEMARGRFIIDEDDKLIRNLCVLAADTADRLLPFN